MLEKYDKSMLYLQQRTQTDISEITGVKNYRDAPPKARLILKAMCIMMDALPSKNKDMRLIRYGAARALQHGKDNTELNVEEGEEDQEKRLKVEEEEDRAWWLAARRFFENTNCLNNLRFFNKRGLSDETEAKVKKLKPIGKNKSSKNKSSKKKSSKNSYMKNFIWDDEDLKEFKDDDDEDEDDDSYDVYDGFDVHKFDESSDDDDDEYEVYDGYEVFSELNQYDDNYEVEAKIEMEDNRPWKLINAVSKWIVAVLSYKSAARENERLHNQENFVRKKYVSQHI